MGLDNYRVCSVVSLNKELWDQCKAPITGHWKRLRENIFFYSPQLPPTESSHQRVLDGLHAAAGHAAPLIKSILQCLVPAKICFPKHLSKNSYTGTSIQMQKHGRWLCVKKAFLYSICFVCCQQVGGGIGGGWGVAAKQFGTNAA